MNLQYANTLYSNKNITQGSALFGLSDLEKAVNSVVAKAEPKLKGILRGSAQYDIMRSYK